MIKVLNEHNCCGCGACSVVCPKKCIEMRPGSLGHLFPFVNEKECIKCNLCNSVCPMEINGILPSTTGENHVAFASFSKDSNIRYRGSSGGVFEVLARRLLQDGYLVYGSAFTNDLKLVCKEASNIDELNPLLKSKYLQSDLTNKYKEIESKLKDGFKVLFVSTPCQVCSLKKFLRKNYSHLITIDFFCHGVPSQKFFDECLEFDEKKRYHNNKILNYQFRYKKKNGRTPHYFLINLKNKNNKNYEICDYYFKSTFYATFQQYINLRESCYDCFFSGNERYSDITFGDFHEIDKYIGNINRFDGISKIITNTNVGLELLKKCSNELMLFPIDFDSLQKKGHCFFESTKRPMLRDLFISKYNESGIEGIYKTFARPTKYIKNKIYYSLPLKIRKIILSRMSKNEK